MLQKEQSCLLYKRSFKQVSLALHSKKTANLISSSTEILEIWAWSPNWLVFMACQKVQIKRVRWDSPAGWLNIFAIEKLLFYFPHWNRGNLLLLFEEWLSGLQVTWEAVSISRLHSAGFILLGCKLYNFPRLFLDDTCHESNINSLTKKCPFPPSAGFPNGNLCTASTSVSSKQEVEQAALLET